MFVVEEGSLEVIIDDEVRMSVSMGYFSRNSDAVTCNWIAGRAVG